jgi:hypothetical protein
MSSVHDAQPVIHATSLLPVAHRGEALVIHVTAPPALGGEAPVIVFSHGAMLGGADYAPLLDGWARRGFLVLAPDHAECGEPLWLARLLDMRSALAATDQAEYWAGVRVRPDLTRCYVGGHSFGAHTTQPLLGALPTEPGLAAAMAGLAPIHGVSAAVLLAPPGDGANGRVFPQWGEGAPYLALDRSGFRSPALVVAGTAGVQPMSPIGWRWHIDAFSMSPPPKTLLTMQGGDHYFGGIVAGRGLPDGAMLSAITGMTAQYLLEPDVRGSEQVGSDVIWTLR